MKHRSSTFPLKRLNYPTSGLNIPPKRCRFSLTRLKLHVSVKIVYLQYTSTNYCSLNSKPIEYWRVGALKVATEGGSNLLSSKEVTMANEPQPSQGSRCLERGGNVASQQSMRKRLTIGTQKQGTRGLATQW